MCKATFTCGEWTDHISGTQGYLDIININSRGEKTCAQYGDYPIDINKNILYQSNLLDVSPKSIEDICCQELETCATAKCPINMKKKDNIQGTLIHDEYGEDISVQVCCEPKICEDWAQDGNICGEGVTTLLKEELGYSETECCFEMCGNWNQRTVKEKIRERFPDITEPTINLIQHTSNLTTEQYINQINNQQPGIVDTGTPVNISNCGENEKIFAELRGNDSSTCCVDSIGTCSSRTWDCPENTYTNIRNATSPCIVNDNSGTTCPENDENIAECCLTNQICSDLTCPTGYIANTQKKDEFCKKSTCSEEDDLDCCIRKGKCSDLYCGIGYNNNPVSDNYHCKNITCSIDNDKDKCCIKNQNCSNMNCPVGYYQKKINKDRNCWNEKCSQDNKLDLLLCCSKCDGVPNASKYTCDEEDGSIVLECNENYILVDGECVVGDEILDINLKLDGNYDDFISDRAHMEKVKEAICNTILKDIPFDDCTEKINIIEIQKGSVIIDFQIENKKESTQKIDMEQIKQIFMKDVVIDGLDMKVKETPIVSNIKPRLETRVKCESNIYKHQCTYGTILNKNAKEIFGTTDKECCRLDWDILKVVIPVFLLGLLFIYIVYRKSLRKIIKE